MCTFEIVMVFIMVIILLLMIIDLFTSILDSYICPHGFEIAIVRKNKIKVFTCGQRVLCRRWDYFIKVEQTPFVETVDLKEIYVEGKFLIIPQKFKKCSLSFQIKKGNTAKLIKDFTHEWFEKYLYTFVQVESFNLLSKFEKEINNDDLKQVSLELQKRIEGQLAKFDIPMTLLDIKFE